MTFKRRGWNGVAYILPAVARRPARTVSTDRSCAPTAGPFVRSIDEPWFREQSKNGSDIGMRKIIVVTGASNGFGRLASNALAEPGTPYTPRCAKRRAAMRPGPPRSRPSPGNTAPICMRSSSTSPRRKSVNAGNRRDYFQKQPARCGGA